MDTGEIAIVEVAVVAVAESAIATGGIGRIGIHRESCGIRSCDGRRKRHRKIGTGACRERIGQSQPTYAKACAAHTVGGDREAEPPVLETLSA